jgi:GNAT superfamily N-acetyltransferase
MIKILPFTPEHYPAIVDIHASQGIIWPEYPRTPETWAESDRYINPGSISQRWVACLDGSIATDGRVVGFGEYRQNKHSHHPHWIFINIEVHPAHQRQGVGSALYEQLLSDVISLNPHALRANAFANLPQGFHFLEKRDFYEAFRETPVHLDINAFDPAPYRELESKLQEKGIRIKTLQELASDPLRDRKVYDLYWEIFDSLPREDTNFTRPPFEAWCMQELHDPTLLQDAYYIAMLGNEYIGLRELYKEPGNNALLGGLLGVRPSYRHQHIGLAMQLRGIQYGRENGIPLLKTCTGIKNTAMQALFNKLGYVRDPEWQQCQKNMLS